jgi:hypothetical protein
MPMLLGMRAANAETLWPTVSFKKESKAFQGLGNPKAGAQPAVEAAQGTKSLPDTSLYALGGCFWPDITRPP